MKKPSTKHNPAPTRNRFRLARILVPLDFSGRSRQALECALPLAERYGARIILTHVVQPVLGPTRLSYEAIDTRRLMSLAKSQLEELAARLVPAELLDRCVVRSGVPYEEVVRLARACKADLIVLTTHGYTGLKRALIGSTAERVVRHAACPVLTVRRRDDVCQPADRSAGKKGQRPRQL